LANLGTVDLGTVDFGAVDFGIGTGSQRRIMRGVQKLADYIGFLPETRAGEAKNRADF
jgi:hypothetical protein